MSLRKPWKKMGSNSDSDSDVTDGDTRSGKLKSSVQKKRKKRLFDIDTDSGDDSYEQQASMPSSRLPITTNSNEIKSSDCSNTHLKCACSIDPSPYSQTTSSSSKQKVFHSGTVKVNDEQISEPSVYTERSKICLGDNGDDDTSKFTSMPACSSSSNIVNAGSVVNSGSSSSSKMCDLTSNSNDDDDDDTKLETNLVDKSGSLISIVAERGIKAKESPCRKKNKNFDIDDNAINEGDRFDLIKNKPKVSDYKANIVNQPSISTSSSSNIVISLLEDSDPRPGQDDDSSDDENDLVVISATPRSSFSHIDYRREKWLSQTGSTTEMTLEPSSSLSSSSSSSSSSSLSFSSSLLLSSSSLSSLRSISKPDESTWVRQPDNDENTYQWAQNNVPTYFDPKLVSWVRINNKQLSEIQAEKDRRGNGATTTGKVTKIYVIYVYIHILRNICVYKYMYSYSYV
jgi:hypothetical protein